jgi:hypothetical protein
VSSRDRHAERDRDSTIRVRLLVFVAASVVVYAGFWLIGSVFGRWLLHVLSPPERSLTWYLPVVWTLCAGLVCAVQAGALWACGVRSARSLTLRTLASFGLTAASFALIELLAMLLSSDMVSMSLRIISAVALPVVAMCVSGIAVLVSFIPQRAVEQRHRADGVR